MNAAGEPEGTRVAAWSGAGRAEAAFDDEIVIPELLHDLSRDLPENASTDAVGAGGRALAVHVQSAGANHAAVLLDRRHDDQRSSGQRYLEGDDRMVRLIATKAQREQHVTLRHWQSNFNRNHRNIPPPSTSTTVPLM
jgi:hypothetical protein